MSNATIGDKNLTRLIREIIRDELKLAGGTKLITSDGDIDIVTKGTHIARYNGVELGSGGGGGSYLPLAGGDMSGNIVMDDASWVKFYTSGSLQYAGYIGGFGGAIVNVLQIDSPGNIQVNGQTITLTADADRDVNINTSGLGKAYYNGIEIGAGGGGTVESVSASLPLLSSGGTTPVISVTPNSYDAYGAASAVQTLLSLHAGTLVNSGIHGMGSIASHAESEYATIAALAEKWTTGTPINGSIYLYGGNREFVLTNAPGTARMGAFSTDETNVLLKHVSTTKLTVASDYLSASVPVFVNSSLPAYYLSVLGVTKTELYWDTNTVLKSKSGDIDFYLNTVKKLTISGATTTITNDLTITNSKTIITPYIKITAGSPSNGKALFANGTDGTTQWLLAVSNPLTAGVDVNGYQLSNCHIISAISGQDLRFDSSTSRKIEFTYASSSRFLIADAAITSTVKIVTPTLRISSGSPAYGKLLSATNADGDTTWVTGSWLPLSAGSENPLTGDLYMGLNDVIFTVGSLTSTTNMFLLESYSEKTLGLNVASSTKSIIMSIVGTEKLTIANTTSTFTNDVAVTKSNPQLTLTHSGMQRLYLTADAVGGYINSGTNTLNLSTSASGKSILLATNDVTKITIADATTTITNNLILTYSSPALNFTNTAEGDGTGYLKLDTTWGLRLLRNSDGDFAKRVTIASGSKWLTVDETNNEMRTNLPLVAAEGSDLEFKVGAGKRFKFTIG